MSSGVFRYTPRTFQKAVDAGVFGERKVELLGGTPYVMTQHPPHIFAVHRIGGLLAAVFPPDRWTVHRESTIRVGRSLPVPDVVVLRHPDGHYLGRLADAGRDAVGDVVAMHEVLTATGSRTRVLLASIRDVDSMVTLARAGVAHFTMAPAVAEAFFTDELTAAAGQAFEDAVLATTR